MEHPISRSQPLTEARIRQILEFLTADSLQMESSDEPTRELLRAYQHLMEVYCVVRAGGVQVQIEATQLAAAKEKSTIQAAMTADPEPADCLHQELLALQKSVAWRISHLQSITPEDEQAVRNCLPEIETTFTQGDRLQ
ncbi:MAG: hypothetical protein F6K19_09600 [Cyanothece sp. SIO1E1]|nr:hypothetical protein [Cyanothece sp. SIO1E1]